MSWKCNRLAFKYSICPKDGDGIANSVDADQTAPKGAVWSESALVAQTCLSQYLEFFTENQMTENKLDSLDVHLILARLFS